jgi:hypothetical protein
MINQYLDAGDTGHASTHEQSISGRGDRPHTSTYGQSSSDAATLNHTKYVRIINTSDAAITIVHIAHTDNQYLDAAITAPHTYA